jgi:hypothetical protein
MRDSDKGYMKKKIELMSWLDYWEKQAVKAQAKIEAYKKQIAELDVIT